MNHCTPRRAMAHWDSRELDTIRAFGGRIRRQYPGACFAGLDYDAPKGEQVGDLRTRLDWAAVDVGTNDPWVLVYAAGMRPVGRVLLIRGNGDDVVADVAGELPLPD